MSTLQEAVTQPDENSLPTPPADHTAEADGSKTVAAAAKREGRGRRRSRKQHAVPADRPPEGAIITELNHTEYAFVRFI